MKYIKDSKERTAEDNKKLTNIVADIISNVRENGDKALHEYNLKFDQSERQFLRISADEIKEAYSVVDPSAIDNIKRAKANIEKFAKVQKESLSEIKSFEVAPGITLGHRVIPIESCCCYVPGGGYPLYSTALMLAVPAKVAGVKRITAAAPPIKGSTKIHPLTLVAMDISGVDEIYAVGGAHAIAAFSYGTDEIKPVDIIVGPGNQFVTEAKRQCYGQVGIDFVAGPSEVLAIADDTANPAIIGADLLGQSEHDFLAKGILVTTSEKVANEVIKEVEKQLEVLSTANIAAQSWSDYGEVILCDDLDEAVEITNEYAPEHLELSINNPNEIIEKLTNYGSLFIGENTAEVFGDYASGTNHTLPTLKAARYTGGVWVGTFLKVCTHQSMTKEAMLSIAPLVSDMAKGEGLMAHSRAAEIRIELANK